MSKDNAASAGAVKRLLADANIRTLAVSPDGRALAATMENQHVIVWSAETGQTLWCKRAGGAGMKFVRALAFSPDSKRLLSGASAIKSFDVATGVEGDGLVGHPKG